MILASAGIVVVALAIALPLVLLRGGSTTAIETVPSSPITVVALPPTTVATTVTTAATTTEATEQTTTTKRPAGDIPGDSAGTWVETSISGLNATVSEVAVSDEALVFKTTEGPSGDLYAYLFASGQTVQLPTDGTTVGGIDIDGTLVVWWEADGADVITGAHVYAYRLPSGPRVEVASGSGVAYPQVAGHMITWVEGRPWATEPDEWYECTIKAADVDDAGQPTGGSYTLVQSAMAALVGDATWTYSLSDGFLAWEQHSDAGAVPAGSYVMGLAERQPRRIDGDAWRPSLHGHRVVYTLDGVAYADFPGPLSPMDSSGDFATAGPTFAAYFRPSPSGDGTAWAVVAKGYTGAHEQVLLADTGDPPWFLPLVAVSARHVAFSFDGTVHLFTWQE